MKRFPFQIGVFDSSFMPLLKRDLLSLGPDDLQNTPS